MIDTLKYYINQFKQIKFAYVFIFYSIELIQLIMNIKFIIKFNNIFYESLKNNEHDLAIRYSLYILIIKLLYSLCSCYSNSIIQKIQIDLYNNKVHETLIELDKVKNNFFELNEYESDNGYNEIVSDISKNKIDKIMKILFKTPEKFIELIHTSTYVFLLLSKDYKITVSYFVIILIFKYYMKKLYELNTTMFKHSIEHITNLILQHKYDENIVRRIINHSPFSQFNDLTLIEKYLYPTEYKHKDLKTKIIYYLVLSELYTLLIINFIFLTIVNRSAILIWYLNYDYIYATAIDVFNHLFGNSFCSDEQCQKINNMINLIKKVGNKKDQINISSNYTLSIKPSNITVGNVNFHIVDEIIIDSGKTILLDGKSGMGKTFLYKIMTGLISEQPEVYLNNKKVPNGFEHFSGQIKYVTPLVTQHYFDSATCTDGDTLTIREHLGVHRTNENIIKVAKLACLHEYDLDSTLTYPSGGETSRIILAKSLPIEETDNIPILILDEPDCGVDYETGLKIINNIIEWYHQNHKGTLFLTTHQKAIKQILKFDNIYEADNMTIKKII